MWAEFLRATDPVPETATNEELQAYFGRVQQANVQFRMDRNPGWLSDRGMVFVALGEPDEVFDRSINRTLSTTQVTSSARLQFWQYRQYNTQLVFYEDTGRWRLTRPSETEFLSISVRRQR
jgi:GWxTD domain-containing protein